MSVYIAYMKVILKNYKKEITCRNVAIVTLIFNKQLTC